MPKVTVGKWGKNVALRMPAEIVQATGLKIGEEVEVDVGGSNGDIVIHRPDAQTRAKARKAADEIKKMSRGHSLRGLSIRELIGRDDH